MESVRCSYREAQELLDAVFRAADFTAAEAAVCRDEILEAEWRGKASFGLQLVPHAMDGALDIAREHRMAVGGARNRWPWLIAGHHLRRAAEEGFVAVTCSAGVPIVAPHGARRRVFGTNPFSIAAPAQDGPIVFDSAITAGPASLLRDAKRAGVPLPCGTAIDADGNPTRDPDAGRKGAMLPFAGHRGSGL